MRTVDLSEGFRLRVWFDGELATGAMEANDAQRAASGSGSVRRAALEIRVYAGPRVLFGFLGCRHLRTAKDFEVKVTAAPEIVGVAADRLGTWFAPPVQFGLLSEYAAAVVRGAMESPSIPLVGGGTVIFDLAAHDPVGSAPAVFRVISRSLVDILGVRAWPPDDETIKRICEEAWQSVCRESEAVPSRKM